MKEKQNLVITIGRQYGSGGRIVGKALAEELGIHFYDEEILTMTSEQSAVGEVFFRLADEKAGNNLLYKIVSGMKPQLGKPSTDGDIVKPENLFRFQSEVIRELADQESCIIAGRCADYILSRDDVDVPGLVKIFVYADVPALIKRTMEVDKVDEKEATRQPEWTKASGSLPALPKFSIHRKLRATVSWAERWSAAMLSSLPMKARKVGRACRRCCILLPISSPAI